MTKFNKGDNKFNNENIQCTDGNTLIILTLLSNWHFCKEDDWKYNTTSVEIQLKSITIDLKGKLLDSLTACLCGRVRQGNLVLLTELIT